MTSPKKIRVEFVALMALIMSIAALATDSLLPALGIIGEHFGVSTTSEKQQLVTMIFLGIGIGQLFAGAFSDSFGRKPVMYAGFAIFIVATFLSVMTDSYEVLVVSRLLQGIGLSAPRTLSTAIIRDAYAGVEMAKVMSFVAMTFILVPAFAPMLGSVLLAQFNWHAIFYVQALIAIIAVIWFALRQPETLLQVNRARFGKHLFTHALKTFWREKQAVIYTLALGFALGAFMVFLSTGESILIGQYGKETEFSYLFGAVALAMGASMMVNGKLVTHYGMLKMTYLGVGLFSLTPLIYLIIFSDQDNPSLWVFMPFLMLQVFSIGFVFGNLTALSMDKLGSIAGMASAITGFVSTLIAVPYASFIGSLFSTTALPLFVGFLLSGLLVVVCLYFANKFPSL